MERMGRLPVGAALLLVLVLGLTLSHLAHTAPLDHRLVASATGTIGDDQQAPTTYQKFLPRALADEPGMQYLLGFMFLHGEGVEGDYDQAHQWLHLAAEKGHKVAQRLLGNFHGGLLSRVPAYYRDPNEARHWFNRVMPRATPVATATDSPPPPAGSGRGEAVYTDYCAACHGVDGHARFPGAPSFAAGERLHKDPAELAHSIVNGKGLMPAWGQSLPAELALSALSYIQSRWGHVTSPPAESGSEEALVRAVQHGEKVYTAFCAGCHGLNGIAYYVDSPSFALGERLDKSDEELLRSIKDGIGEMPNWDDKLSEEDVQALVTFVRSLEPAYEAGITGEVRAAEASYFVFKTSKEKGSKSLPATDTVNETATR